MKERTIYITKKQILLIGIILLVISVALLAFRAGFAIGAEAGCNACVNYANTPEWLLNLTRSLTGSW